MATHGMVVGSLMPFLRFRGFTYPDVIILSEFLLKIGEKEITLVKNVGVHPDISCGGLLLL